MAKKSTLSVPLSYPLFLYLLFILIGVFTILVVFISLYQGTSPKENKKSSLAMSPTASIQTAPQYATLSGTIRVPILMYHYVEIVADQKDTFRQALTIKPAVFEAQLKTLKEANFTFLTAKELGEIIDGKYLLPKNPIVITFDDGHWDLYTDVLPLLKKYQVPVTAYIIPGRINGSDFLTTAQLHELAKSGLFEIASHTINHVALKGKTLKIQTEEIVGSKRVLEQELGIPIVSFAYPDGSFDDQAKRIVKDAGYTNAVSTLKGTAQGSGNRYTLYRLRPGNRTGNSLLSFLAEAQKPPH